MIQKTRLKCLSDPIELENKRRKSFFGVKKQFNRTAVNREKKFLPYGEAIPETTLY